MRIVILSDTHGLLRPEVLEALEGADAILHGGDINTQAIVDRLRGCAPLYIVQGNNDKEWAENLPVRLDFELGGLKFFLTHNRKDIPQDTKADIIIFGHSHKYHEENIDGQLWLNPGSCGRKRFNLPITMAVLNIKDNKYSIEKIEL